MPAAPLLSGPVPRPVAAHPAELSGRKGHGTSSGVAASPPRKARAEVHGLCQWGGWPSPCPHPSLATRASPKCGAFPTPSSVVSAILGTMPRSDSLRTAPAFAFQPYTGPCFRGVRLAVGCGRASPVDQPTFAACRLLYAGAVPGCSRIHGPDCCLRPKAPGSARSVPYGVVLSTRQSSLSLRPAASLLLASAPGSRPTPENLLPRSSGGLPGRDSHPPVDWPFAGHTLS